MCGEKFQRKNSSGDRGGARRDDYRAIDSGRREIKNISSPIRKGIPKIPAANKLQKPVTDRKHVRRFRYIYIFLRVGRSCARSPVNRARKGRKGRKAKQFADAAATLRT